MTFSSASEGVAVEEKSLNHRGAQGGTEERRGNPECEMSVLKRQTLSSAATSAGKKNAGLKAATLISVSNPVSQVLW
jgi:hypothetical protein